MFRSFLTICLITLLATNCFATKVWLVHSSHTGGHRAAANALAKALNEKDGVEAEVINTMDYLPKSLKWLQKTAFAVLTKTMPEVKKKAFESSIEGKETAKKQAIRWLGVKAWFSRSLLKRIRKEKPDVIVSTHSQTNVMIGIWKKHKKIEAPLHCVVTDYNTHTMWAIPWVDKYYVATEFVKERLVHYGVEADRVTITGIPTSPSFARVPLVDKTKAKTLLNLDSEVPTITMMGGSLGYGPYVKVARALEENGEEVQLLAMCAKNETVRAELDELSVQLSHVRIYTYGFVDRFYRFMDAADAVITKPGGLTVTELLCRRKPMIFIKPALGLEKHVAGAIASLGVAHVSDSAEGGAFRAFEEASNEDLQTERLEAIEAAVKPTAVFDIADLIVQH